MASIRLGSIALDCADPGRLASFWADLLGGEVAFTSDAFAAIKADRIWLAATRVEDYQPPTWPEAHMPKTCIWIWPSTTPRKPSNRRLR